MRKTLSVVLCAGAVALAGVAWAAPKPTRIRVLSIPKARVFVDGKLVGVSPTKPIDVKGPKVTVRLEHAGLGSEEFDVTPTPGKTTDIKRRW